MRTGPPEMDVESWGAVGLCYELRVPVRSMTGFGSALATTRDAAGRRLQIEIRAVNGRFLEVRSKHPFGARVTDAISKRVQARLGRGRVEVLVAWREPEDTGQSSRSGGPSASRLEEAARALVRAQSAAATAGLSVTPPSAEALWSVAATLEANAARQLRDAPELETPEGLDEVLDLALDALCAMREQEGAALHTVLHGHLEALDGVRASIVRGLAESRDAQEASLRTRVARWLEALGEGTLDPARLHAEVATVAARADVSEELDRLSSHLQQARVCLDAPAARGQGKKLDFIAQELGREWTTTGSKLASAALCALVVDAKEMLERFKEQVQNVE